MNYFLVFVVFNMCDNGQFVCFKQMTVPGFTVAKIYLQPWAE